MSERARTDNHALTTVALRDYVEALFNEQQRATEMAEREREKAATVLRSEQLRTQQTAEQERAKSADALAASLAQSIREGDERLREHITQQVKQIEAALAAAQRETLIQHEASEKAIAKAEAANEKRFGSVNEFRVQLADQATLFLPREVFDAQFADLNKRVGANTDNINTTIGKSAGVSSTVGYFITAATIVISLVVLLANGTV